MNTPIKTFFSKKINTALIIGSLFAAASASANLSFTVDEFTNDVLTITISGASTLGGAMPGENNWSLFLADTSGTSSFTTAGITGAYDLSVAIGAIDIFSASTISLLGGTVPTFVFHNVLTAGDALGADETFTFAGVGLFDVSAVSELGLYWGTEIGSNPTGGTLQEVAAVPELSSSALMLGLFALSAGAVYKRRRA